MQANQTAPEREFPSLNKKIKAVQLVFPRLDLSAYEQNKEQYIELVRRGVGGFCIFNASADLCRRAFRELNSFAEIPLLFACDMEFGTAMRFSDGTAFPRAGSLGRSGNPGYAYITSKITALEARSCGIFWNFAPLADVASNPDNPIIGLRAFSDNPSEVVKYITAWTNAAKDERMLSCVKHFPGHGDTSTDSHISLPVLKKSLAELSQCELLPFYFAIKYKVDSIMVGHLAVPALDPSGTPASLSRKIVSDFLRDKLKYNGIIVTDALDMHSVNAMFEENACAFRAIEAGNDVALMPEKPIDSIDYIEANIDNLDGEQIEDSFDRLIKAKRFCGLMDGIANNLPQPPDPQQSREIAQRTAEACIRLDGGGGGGGDKNEVIPLVPSDSYTLVCVICSEKLLPNAVHFSQLLQSKTTNDCDIAFIDNTFSEDDADSLQKSISGTNKLFIAIFQSPMGYVPKNPVSETATKFLSSLANSRETVLIHFAPDGIGKDIPADLCIDTMSDDASSMEVVAGMIAGSGEVGYINNLSEAYRQKRKLEEEIKQEEAERKKQECRSTTEEIKPS